jgi:hypothetical protein
MLNTTMKTQIGSTSMADLKGVSEGGLEGEEQVEQTAVQHCAVHERADQSEGRGPAFEDAIREKRLNGSCFVEAEGYQDEKS